MSKVARPLVCSHRSSSSSTAQPSASSASSASGAPRRCRGSRAASVRVDATAAVDSPSAAKAQTAHSNGKGSRVMIIGGCHLPPMHAT
ncbi:MAG: hypothetical protein WDW36_003405 [Sanguina aurantia]